LIGAAPQHEADRAREIGNGASLMKTGQSTLVMVRPQRSVTRGSTPSVARLTAPIAERGQKRELLHPAARARTVRPAVLKTIHPAPSSA
jgi:hypothetical protein